MTKQDYISNAEDRFAGKTRELILNQIELFFCNEIPIIDNKYKIGDEVILKKGTFIHGIYGILEYFDWTIENGFISNDFTQIGRYNKIKNSVGMWNIKKDCLLRDYINEYSGFTITYTIGRGPGSTEVCKLVPYHKFDEYTEKLNEDDTIWQWWGEQTKEVRFIPSLVASKRQIAFILNMESGYAKKLSKLDIWDTNIDDETVEPFLDYRYYPKFLEERKNRKASTTDRESAIIFGLPSSLIEGVLVGKIVESNDEVLDYIKNKLPNAYICNLFGKVIR